MRSKSGVKLVDSLRFCSNCFKLIFHPDREMSLVVYEAFLGSTST